MRAVDLPNLDDLNRVLFNDLLSGAGEVIHEFNVNNYVMVRLTDVGINELKKQHDDLVKTFPSIKTNFEIPKADADGFSKWQLHHLMSTFGHLMHLGFEVPFETTILFRT